MMELKLVQHLVVNADGSLPEIPDCLYAYIMAGNGVFVHARRPGLEVLVPVTECKIAGLPGLAPQVNVPQCVSAFLISDVLRVCKQVFPGEALFWFNWVGEWSIHIPQQQITKTSVVPCDRHDETGTSALIDLHSHASFPPFFSSTDDKDETGFRIYAVIGNVDKTPTISVRVGVYSHYFNIPASTVFELPDGIQDIYEKEEVQYEAE
jgi:PRTRC genetic system protein A